MGVVFEGKELLKSATFGSPHLAIYDEVGCRCHFLSEPLSVFCKGQLASQNTLSSGHEGFMTMDSD